MWPIGYVYDGAVYCELCLRCAGIDPDGEEVGAIFESSESDNPEHCGDCHEFLGGVLTEEGFKMLREDYLHGHWRNKDLLRLYIEHYDYHDWYFIPTFYGWLNPLGDLKDID